MVPFGYERKINRTACKHPGCQKVFDNPDKAKAHFKGVHGPRIKCPVEGCSKTWAGGRKQKDIDAHVAKFHKKDTFYCEQCDKSMLGNELTKKNHMRASHDLFACEVCGEQFTFNRLKLHLRDHNPSWEPEMCEERGVPYVKLDQHMKLVHDKSFECDEPGCDKVYGDSYSLARHKEVHHDGPPVRCGPCGYQAPSHDHYIRHLSSKDHLTKMDKLSKKREDTPKELSPFQHTLDLSGKNDALDVSASVPWSTTREFFDFCLQFEYPDTERSFIESRNVAFLKHHGFTAATRAQTQGYTWNPDFQQHVRNTILTCQWEECKVELDMSTSWLVYHNSEREKNPSPTFGSLCAAHYHLKHNRDNRGWYQARLAAGLCTRNLSCTNDIVPGYGRCQQHIDKDRENALLRLVTEHGIDTTSAYDLLREHQLSSEGLHLQQEHLRGGPVLYGDTEFFIAEGSYIPLQVALFTKTGQELYKATLNYDMHWTEVLEEFLPPGQMPNAMQENCAKKHLSVRKPGDIWRTPGEVVDDLTRLDFKRYSFVEYSTSDCDIMVFEKICQLAKRPNICPPRERCFSLLPEFRALFQRSFGVWNLPTMFAAFFPRDRLVKIHHFADIDSLKLQMVADLLFNTCGRYQKRLRLNDGKLTFDG